MSCTFPRPAGAGQVLYRDCRLGVAIVLCSLIFYTILDICKYIYIYKYTSVARLGPVTDAHSALAVRSRNRIPNMIIYTPDIKIYIIYIYILIHICPWPGMGRPRTGHGGDGEQVGKGHGGQVQTGHGGQGEQVDIYVYIHLYIYI